MLSGRDGRFFLDAVVRRDQVVRVHRLDLSIAQVVAETPVVFRADEALAGPLVISPPHGPQREEVLHLFGVVLVELLGVVRVAVVRMVRVGLGGGIVVRVGMLRMPAALASTVGVPLYSSSGLPSQ